MRFSGNSLLRPSQTQNFRFSSLAQLLICFLLKIASFWQFWVSERLGALRADFLRPGKSAKMSQITMKSFKITSKSAILLRKMRICQQKTQKSARFSGNSLLRPSQTQNFRFSSLAQLVICFLLKIASFAQFLVSERLGALRGDSLRHRS